MKKLIRIYLSLVIALSPIILINQANAGTVGGWTMSNPIAQGASTIYNGAKTVLINGAEVVKNGTAKITPTATGVAKVLARGGAVSALSVAVEQLIGAVDWVLDPANNQIRYKLPSDPTGAYLYNRPSSGSGGPFIYTLAQAQTKVCEIINSIVGTNYTLTNCSITGVNTSNPAKVVFNFTYDQINSNGSTEKGKKSYYDSYGRQVAETPEQEERRIPLPTVAQQVISNANSGDTNAQVATMAAAADIVKEAETDSTKAPPIVQQLENTAVTPTDETATGTQTKNPTNPDVTDLSLEFPAFCGWAPMVCEAAQTVISFPTTLQSWADAVALAWANFWEEPNLEKDDSTVEVEEKEIQDPSQFDQMYVQFGGQCPSFEATTISVGPVSVPLSFDLSPLCDFALFVRPAVLGIAYLGAMGIVTAAIREV